MRFFILSALLLASLAAGQTADGIEIQKQRLIKFPEEIDANVAPPTSNKSDEAQRILDQIAKVNEAFGYVKKRKTEQSKLPPILDSSQYLFPKPAQSPFHAQQHHFAGSNGQTLLEPSIRAVKLTRNAFSDNEQLYFRPHQVQLPKPSSTEEAKQLPEHFVIPVHLYKQNKSQYLREHAAEEYKIKGYKIIGDVDSFYGKAKTKQLKSANKNTPKYHLFFLPRELAFNEDGTLKRGTSSSSSSSSTTSTTTATTRAPKETQLKPQMQTQTQSQRIPVQVVPEKNLQRQRLSTTKPMRVAAKEGAQVLPVLLGTTQPPKVPPSNSNLSPSNNRLTGFRVPSMNLAEMQNQTSTVIKNAFQNIFKPFRNQNTAGNTPAGVTPAGIVSSPGILLQTQPNKDSDSALDDYKWDDERLEGAGDGSELDTLENTAAEQDNSAAEAEKHLFAHKPHKIMETIGTVATAHHGTQKQALREGGIIIQRLKVRKGGIAIAGPGGVATAGSGGTAIVGPGGYALTHPRSLTIAGPGAKVIAIPADVDLKDALQRTDVNARSFPREGKVVATGPTVYYAPPTGKEEEADQTVDVQEDFEA